MSIISELRQSLEAKMKIEFGNTVLHGPYQKMKLPEESYWGIDTSAMRFGLYEKEILDLLKNFCGKRFVNIGAGDGYYVVGEVFRDAFEEAICFELNSDGRQKILQLAESNEVLQRITILGAADETWLELCGNPLDVGLVLCDIEGGEFDIFNSTHFKRLAKCPIVIEIHDWVDGATKKIEKLIEDSSETHNLNVLKTGSRDLSEFEELKNYSDEERWLLVMEGRPKLMSWFYFAPKKLSKNPLSLRFIK